MVEIKGLERTSLINYPGKISCVVFLPGCNFRCPYCQNPDLFKPEELDTIPEEEFFGYLRERKAWLDGVVITGGEPTIHRNLPEFIKKIKAVKYLVCLETNGTNPEMLEGLLKEKLLDYIAMDVKAAPEKYPEVVHAEVEMEKVERCADIVKNSGMEYQFRTTYVPGLVGKDDAEKIGQWLDGAESYAIQNFNPKRCLDKTFESKAPYVKKELEEIAAVARKFFKKVEVRG